MRPSRGFLTADVPAHGLTPVATHLKSSRGRAGESDHENVMQREVVAAAMAMFVAERLKENPGVTVLVAGDMNVGETDLSKNGFRLDEDKYDRNSGDLYDDTHAILSAGLIDGLQMASLTKGLETETYDDIQFAGAGPIDCIYVIGRLAGEFTLAKKSDRTFGSDHFAVSTRMLASSPMPPPAPALPPKDVMEAPVRIAAVMPNPFGQDEGKEWVLLANTSDKPVDLTHWKLRDKAGHLVTLQGTIAPHK